MLKCNFNKGAKQYGCSPVNLLHIFRRTFLKNISGRLLLDIEISLNFEGKFQLLYPQSVICIFMENQ